MTTKTISAAAAIAVALVAVSPGAATAAAPDKVSFSAVSLTSDGVLVELKGNGTDKTPGTGLDGHGVIQVKRTFDDGTVRDQRLDVVCVNVIGNQAVVVTLDRDALTPSKVKGSVFYVEDGRSNPDEDTLLEIGHGGVSEAIVGAMCNPLAVGQRENVDGEITVTDGTP